MSGFEQMDQKALMLGGHEARLDALENVVKETRDDVKAVLAFMENSKGSWRAIMGMATMVGSVVGLLDVAAHWLFHKP